MIENWVRLGHGKQAPISHYEVGAIAYRSTR